MAASVLLFIFKLAVIPELIIPVKTEAPEPNDEQFCIVFPVMEIVPVAELFIPKIVVTAVVTPPVPIAIELAVALPMLLSAIVKLPAAPAVLIP